MIRPGMVVRAATATPPPTARWARWGFGIGTSEVEHVLATQTLVYRLARDMRIRVDGTSCPGAPSPRTWC
jgi:3-isopropylmalate/(R)-2-methylmalate dehydratase large subunit